MGIIIGVLAAIALWWVFKLSVYTLILFLVVGAVIGTIPRWFSKAK